MNLSIWLSRSYNTKRGGSQYLDLFDQVVNVGEEWVEPAFVLLIIAGLPNE
jgi:hypothetical protein